MPISFTLVGRRLARVVIVVALGFTASAAAAQDGLPAFSDRAAEVGLTLIHELGGNYDHANYTGGGAVGDFDRDGWQDVFALSGGGSGKSDKLFMNKGDAGFVDEAVAWGLGAVHLGKAATAGDFDDDGWLDLFVTSAGVPGDVGPGHHKLWRNNGNRSFTDVASEMGVDFSHPTLQDGFGAAFGDYDLDGDLDLFVAGFRPNNSGNRLFRNTGDGHFEDVTESIDLWGTTPIGLNTFAPRFADMNGDRHPELLLAADFGTSRYLRNDGDGTFTDVTDSAGTGLDENGMGQAVADFNGDGLPDWYVTSIYWPDQQWTGNKLYLNRGNDLFVEVAAQQGIDDGGYGWGVVTIDMDHDGRVDWAATNGGDFTPKFQVEQTYLWMNKTPGLPQEQALALGLAHFGEGRGMVNLDYDEDGDQDIVIFTHEEQLSLWRNDLAGEEIHWLRVFLDTTAHDGLAPDGYGTHLVLEAGGITQHRWLVGGDNYLGNSELSAHFGLGAATQVDNLRVEWSDGSVTELGPLAADQTITVSAPPDDGFTRYGLGVGGAAGTIRLNGAGDLSPGSPTGFELHADRLHPGATAFLLVGFEPANLPFKQAHLLVFPFSVQLPLGAAPADGVVTLALEAPPGTPAGLSLFSQVWVLDPSAPAGFASSNGLRLDVP